jgi:hypothetical protein
MWEHQNKVIVFFLIFILINVFFFILLYLLKYDIYKFYIIYLIIPFFIYVFFYYHPEKESLIHINLYICFIFYLPLAIILFYYPYSFFLFYSTLMIIIKKFYSNKEIFIFNIGFLLGITLLFIFSETLDIFHFIMKFLEILLFNIILVLYNK